MTKESHFLGHAVQEWAGKDKRWYFHLPYNPAAALLIERLQYLAPAVGTEGGQAVWYCRPGQKPQVGVLLSQNAVKACILLTGHDLPVLYC